MHTIPCTRAHEHDLKKKMVVTLKFDHMSTMDVELLLLLMLLLLLLLLLFLNLVLVLLLLTILLTLTLGTPPLALTGAT